MVQLFTALVVTSAAGTVLALILALLRPVTSRFFSARWHYYMGLAVLLVMILPIRLTLPERSVPMSQDFGNVSFTDDKVEVPTTQTDLEMEFDSNILQNLPTDETDKTTAFQSAKEFFAGKAFLLSLLWVTVTVLLFLVKSISYLTFLVVVKKRSVPTVCPEIESYTRRNVRVRVSDYISSPLLIGVFFPTILLPNVSLSEAQLHYVLSHETTHLKRHDIIFKWFISAVKNVHWFNPVIYFIARQIDSDCEISCDTEVVSGMDDIAKKEYAETILSLLAKRSSKSYPLTTGMTGNKKTLKRRFTMLKSKLKISKRTAIISAILAVLILSVTLTVSGMLNGYFVKKTDSTDLNVITDEIPDPDSATDASHKFNFLLAGVDEKGFFDTIILFKIENGGIKAMGIPLHHLNFNLRNLPFYYGSDADQILIDTIKNGLDVPVHYYVKMELSATEKIIDSLGGIDFDIHMDMDYSDPFQDLQIDLKKGTQHLSGEEVCQLLRYRAGYPDSMVGRTNIHMAFVKEFIDQKLTVNNIVKAPAIFETVSDNIKTNYPIGNLEQDLRIIAAIGSKNYTYEMLPLSTELPIVVK